MAVHLKNKEIEIEIDLPEANYQFSRFDWSGKIVSARYKGHTFAGAESLDRSKDTHLGKGFYNEFGIQSPVGYDLLPVGSWCHKIGVGLVKKDEHEYNFTKSYELQPIVYSVDKDEGQLKLRCEGASINGYAYLLEKTIQLSDQGFEVHYYLENTGIKPIQTTEYNHNFIAIDNTSVNDQYILRFFFDLDQHLFDEYVDPENNFIIKKRHIGFKKAPTEEFFIANISGNRSVKAQWAIEHQALRLGLQETADFMTTAINLWGTKHVISPELFLKIDLSPGSVQHWTRSYRFYEIDR